MSGLECNDRNVVDKSGLQRVAAELGLIVIAPDTSPRNDFANVTIILIMALLGGLGYAGEDDSWDFGTGAGFYVDATQEPWRKVELLLVVTTRCEHSIRAIGCTRT